MFRYYATVVFIILCTACPAFAQPTTAQELIEQAWDYMRETTSRAELEMRIHRPDWERSMSMTGWTMNRDTSLFKITGPARDKGNGTLKKGRDMWTYNPKVHRVIRIPPSMMSQSWMGSDFSNNDLSRADSILLDYDHTLLVTKTENGHTIYRIQSIPKPHAPVVWGKQIITVRDDFVLLEQVFYDEDMAVVKTLSTSEITTMGGKPFPAVWDMRKSDTEDEYTQLRYHSLEFDLDLPASMFTVNGLKKPVR